MRSTMWASSLWSPSASARLDKTHSYGNSFFRGFIAVWLYPWKYTLIKLCSHDTVNRLAAKRWYRVLHYNDTQFWYVTTLLSSSGPKLVFPRSVATATINLSFTEMWRLFEGGVYSRAAFILSAGLPPFPAAPPALMWTLSSASRTHTCARDGWPLSHPLFIDPKMPSCRSVRVELGVPEHLQHKCRIKRPLLCLCHRQTLVFASASVKGVESIARRQRDRLCTSAHVHCNCSYEYN